MNKRIFLRIVFAVLTLVFLAYIWWNSAQNGVNSSGMSKGVLSYVSDVFVLFGIDMDTAEHIIRKLAHFTEFSILGFLLGGDVVLWKSSLKYAYMPLFLGLLVALLDETIQIFAIGRSSSVKDVWLDFSGIIFGTIVLYITRKIYNRLLKRTG